MSHFNQLRLALKQKIVADRDKLNAELVVYTLMLATLRDQIVSIQKKFPEISVNGSYNVHSSDEDLEAALEETLAYLDVRLTQSNSTLVQGVPADL